MIYILIMARPLRLEFPGAVYHVTSRGNARGDIFLGDADREAFLGILAGVIGRQNWLCHAYCLMDNHYHLLLETVDPTLSLGMRQLNGIYTQTFNRSHQRVGHVFQGRYKAILVEKDSHLLQLCRYVVLNPVAANMVNAPEKWPWSSYRVTAGMDRAGGFLATDWLLRQFARQKKVARKRYIEFVREGMATPEESPWKQLTGQIYLGGSRFVNSMQELLGNRKEIGEIPRSQRFPGRPALPEIFQDVTDKTVRNRGIRSAHLEYGYTLREIADFLEVHYSTVSRIANAPG